MTYDLSPSLFLENGPAVQAAAARSANRSAHDFARAWRTYDRDHRLALVESQLRAA
jgi:hypothetical protein